LRNRLFAAPNGETQVREGGKAGFDFTADELRSVTDALQFLERAGTDTTLGDAVRGATHHEIVATGAAAGWTFTVDDLEAIAEESARELTDDELEQVAGGYSFPNVRQTPPFGIPIPYPRW
jgi:predicted ribosomally synthesized peptide with nif11-like leader